MKEYISGRIYLLHRFIVTKYVDYYEPFETKGLFLLCAGNLDNSKSDLYVRTGESKWLKWPVNIDECKIYLSVEGSGTCFEKPDIYIDDKGRYCFDAITLLNNKKIGYVSTNPYSSHARIGYSTTYGYVCSGGVWNFCGKRGSLGTLTIVCSDTFLKMNDNYIYMITVELECDEFVKKPELSKIVTDFINLKRRITQKEMVDFLSEFSVVRVEIRFYDSDIMLVSHKDFSSFDYEKDFRMAVTGCGINEMSGLDLAPLVSCSKGNGILLYLNECEGYGVPGRLILRDGKKEKSVQVMMNPNSDYIVYKDLISGHEIIQKIEQFNIVNNMIVIDINSWLSEHGIEYLVQPFKYHKDAYSNDIDRVKYELAFPEDWRIYIEKYEYFTIEEKFDDYSFIFLRMCEPAYGMVRIIYIGSSFEDALQRLLGEFNIEEDIKEKITDKMILNGLNFRYDARFGKGEGYVELIDSYQKLTRLSELMGIRDLILKKYPIKRIDKVMTSFWDNTPR